MSERPISCSSSSSRRVRRRWSCGGAVEAVAGARALGLDQPDALDVAQHARRPAGGLRGLVDGQSVHLLTEDSETLTQLCQGWCVGSRPSCRPAPRSSPPRSRTPASTSCFGLPGVHNLALWDAVRRSADPARRRPPRADRRLRGRRLRARHREARRRADDDRPGRGEHARRRRRGVGVALAGARDRHRHPDHAAPTRASTAACCTRPTARRRCSGRSSKDVHIGAGPRSARRSRTRSRRRSARPYLEVPTDELRAPATALDRAARRPTRGRAIDPDATAEPLDARASAR